MEHGLATARSGAHEPDEDTLLRRLGQGGFVQFHPALAARLGFKAAIFLGHALYWSRHLARHEPHRNGWFYMTARQWQDATGLSTREQAAVRELLAAQQILHERMGGHPARLHYRVDLVRLAQWAGLQGDDQAQTAITWDAFTPWLKSSISFYRPLAQACGSVAAGLYLAYLLRQQCAAARSGAATFDGFFRISFSDARIALSLGAKTQRNVRSRLLALGFLHECGANLCRVDLQVLQAALALGSQAPAAEPSLRPVSASRPASRPEADMPAERWLQAPSRSEGKQAQLSLDRWLEASSQGRQMTEMIAQMLIATAPSGEAERAAPEPETPCQSVALLSNLQEGNSAASGLKTALLSKQSGPFVESNSPFCRTHIQQQNNKTTTTARADANGPSLDKPLSRRRISENLAPQAGKSKQRRRPLAQTASMTTGLPAEVTVLQMPRALDERWHESVRRTLVQAPAAIRQSLIDELEGQLAIQGKTIHNPPGYLHALIRRHASGSLDLAMASKVAADRREREHVAGAIRRATGRDPGGSDCPAPKVAAAASKPSPAVTEARKQLRELRQRMVSK